MLLLFSLAISLCFILAAFLGAWKARKYVWQMSVSRIILLLVSAVISTLISCGVAFLCVKILQKPISSMAVLSSFSSLNIGISIVNVLAVTVGIIASALLFIPIFWIVRGLMKLFLRLLTKGLVKLTKKKGIPTEGEDTEQELLELAERKKYEEFRLKKANWISVLCGGICGFLTMFMMAIPVVGLLSATNDIVAPAVAHVELGNKPVAKLTKVLDASANNVASKAVSVAGGKLMFNSMTYCKADDNATSKTVRQDIADASEIAAIAFKYGTIKTFFSNSQGALANEQSTYEIITVLYRNPRLYHTVDMISDEVIKGFLFKVRVPEHKELLYPEFIADIQAVSGDDETTLAEWYGEVFDTYGIKVTDDQNLAAARAKLEEKDMLLWVSDNIVSDEEHFRSKTECISVDDVIAGEPNVVDKQKEAKYLSHAIAMVCSLDGNVNAPTFDIKKMMNDLGPIFDTYAHTQTVGPTKTEYMLEGILQSKLVHDKVGMTVLGASESAKSIYENATSIGYTSMMTSLSKAVEVVEAASSTDKDTTAAVKAMLADLTPQSSKVLQTMSTPSVMRRYGVPERSAAPVSSMVSNTFKNLSDAKEKGMSDEEYQKESVAVSNMMDVLMSTDKKSKATFGEGSVTGVTAKEYVNNIMDSKVMSATVVDKVYAGGTEPTEDPLNSRRLLSEEEKAELTGALNENWSASDKSIETQKKLVSISAMLNVKVTLNAEGSFEVVEPEQQG